jgi:hypothetical protein
MKNDHSHHTSNTAEAEEGKRRQKFKLDDTNFFHEQKTFYSSDKSDDDVI